MTIIKPLFLFFLFIPMLGLSNGCATLPNVSEMIDENSPPPEPPQIVSLNGQLSPQKGKAIPDRLSRSADPEDLLEQHNYVMDSLTGCPLTEGNRVTLLVDDQATYAAMFEAIQNAENHINLETFIIDDDETGRRFADMLLKKRAEGVQVNLIFDSVGSFGTPASFFQRLREGGIQVVEFNPVNPFKVHGHWSLAHRDHRKMLIVDGKVAIMGGINNSETCSGRPSRRYQDEKVPLPWRDTDVRIEGPAVAELQKLFLATWLKQKGPELSGRTYFPGLKEEGNVPIRILGSTPGESNRVAFIAYVSAIIFAEHSVHMTNGYFVPDDQILNALTDAARRGVDVKIILPSASDYSVALEAARYHYSELLNAGVKLFELRDALLHSKTAVIDGVWSSVGSSNMDFWSLLTDDEVDAVILSPEFAVEMEKMFDRDLAESDQIQWEEWKKRPLLPRIREWFAHLLSHWL